MNKKAFELWLVAFSLFTWSLGSCSSAAQVQSDSFDKASKVLAVYLGPSPYYAPGPYQRHGELRCHYFPTFVVKELDWGQKGDDWISFAPNDSAHLNPCVEEHAKGEAIIPGKDGYAGYFDGVKGNFVFLRAADCLDRGCPFEVFEASTRKKLFKDWRRLSAKGEIAEIRFARIGHSLVMRYPRVVAAKCSLPLGKSGCWNKILRSTGLPPQPLPKCIGYDGFSEREVFGTSDQRDPSVISFPVEVTIPGFKQRILPGQVQCWSAD